MTRAEASDKFGIAVQVMHVSIRDCKRHPDLRCNRVSWILQAWAYAQRSPTPRRARDLAPNTVPLHLAPRIGPRPQQHL
jgi:hypothetical protein